MTNKNIEYYFLLVILLASTVGCQPKQNKVSALDDVWRIDSQDDWQKNIAHQTNLKIDEGKAEPTSTKATLQSTIKIFAKSDQ